jgi:hypothetical protein
VNADNDREADLLYGNGNKFGIYQIRDGIDEARNFRFAPMRELEALGLIVNRANYELVYTAPLTERIEFLSDRYPVLNKIYEDFNIRQPADYAARSLSVSDVVVLKYNGDIASFYVDSGGFKELDAFLGDETQWADALKREQERNANPENNAPDTYSQVGNRSEDYTGKTSAELETDVKAGKVISLSGLSKAVNAERGGAKERKDIPKSKKPTLMERLEAGRRRAAAQDGQKSAPHRDSDKEARA